MKWMKIAYTGLATCDTIHWQNVSSFNHRDVFTKEGSSVYLRLLFRNEERNLIYEENEKKKKLNFSPHTI